MAIPPALIKVPRSRGGKKPSKSTRKKGGSKKTDLVASYLPGLPWKRVALWAVILTVLFFGLRDFDRFLLSAAPRPTIEVNGCRIVSVEAVVTVVQDFLTDKTVWSFVPYFLQAELKQQFPRFEKIDISRDFEGHVLVRVKERRPVGLIAVANPSGSAAYMHIDKTGTLFEVFDRNDRVEMSLPRVFGLQKYQPDSDDFQDRIPVALSLLALSKQYRVVLEWIDLTDEREVVVKAAKSDLKVYLGHGQLRQKLKKLAVLLSSKQIKSFREYINLKSVRAMTGR